MYKTLIISDFHIGKFNYGISAEERYQKFIETAMNIVRVADEKKVDCITVLGDMVHNAICIPDVLNCLDKVLKILSKYPIKYILGNHDVDSKECYLNKSYFPIFNKYNMQYMDGVTENIEDLEVYYRNYQREPLYPKEKDIILTHHDFIKSFPKDVRYNLFIAGHVHKYIRYTANAFSVGCPIQVQSFETEEASAILLTLESRGWKVTHIELPIILKLEKQEKKVPQEEVQRYIMSPDLDELMQENGIEDVYAEIDKSSIPEPICLNFKLQRLHIENFKNIKDMTIDFNDLGKRIFLRGANGSGKTSVLEALYVVFTGSVNNYQSIKYNAPVLVEVEFIYQDTEYKIVKSKENTRLFKGVEELTNTIKGKREMQTTIEELFPFVKMLKYFYVKSYSHFFVKENRYNLLSYAFNLYIYQYLYEQGMLLRSEVIKKLDNLRNEYNITKSNIETINGIKNELYMNIEEISSKIKVTSSQADNGLKQVREQEKIQDERESVLKELAELNTYDFSRLEELEKEFTEQQKIAERNSKIKATNLEIKSIQHQIDTLRSSTKLCPNCGYVLLSYDNEISSLENKLKGLEYKELIPEHEMISFEKLTDLKTKYLRLCNLNEKIKTLIVNDKILNAKEYVNEQVALINRKKEIVPIYNNRVKEIEELKNKQKEEENELLLIDKKIRRIDKFISCFDAKNINSIPVKILQSISVALSTDNLEFTTNKLLKNGNMALDINIRFNNILYENASEGEKTYIDFLVLQVLLQFLGTIGVLILDESLCCLSSERYQLVSGIIAKLQCNNLLITSHSIDFNEFDDIIEL